MIVFELICDAQHRFEGWFASGEDFASQKRRGLLVCPVCGGVHVEKLPVARIRKQVAEAAQSTPDRGVEVGQGGSADMSRVIDYILAHSEDVGRQFADEARKIYYDQAPQRNIRGIASRGEAEELREEGVPVFSLPVPPQDQWN